MLVNTTELQSHFLATSKGRTFHKLRQQQAKPLENPFIGHVFTEEPGAAYIVRTHTHTHTHVSREPMHMLRVVSLISLYFSQHSPNYCTPTPTMHAYMHRSIRDLFGVSLLPGSVWPPEEAGCSHLWPQ